MSDSHRSRRPRAVASSSSRRDPAASRPSVNRAPRAEEMRTLRTSARIDEIRNAAKSAVEPSGDEDAAQSPSNRKQERTAQTGAPRPRQRTRIDAEPSRRKAGPSSSSASGRVGDQALYDGIWTKGSSSSSKRAAHQNAPRPRRRNDVQVGSVQGGPGRRGEPSSARTDRIRGGHASSGQEIRTRKKGRGSRSRMSRRIVVAVCMVALVLGAGIFLDHQLTDGKIHAGVSIGDIDVGGKTKQEAVDLVSNEYSHRVASNAPVFFATADDQANPKEYDTDPSLEEQISYEESLDNRTQWTVPASYVEATLDVDALVEDAYQVGRDNGGLVARIQSALGGWLVAPVCTFNGTLLDELRLEMTKAVGQQRINWGVEVKDGVASTTQGQDGNEITYEWLVDRLNAAYLGTEEAPSTVLEATYLPLQIDEAAAQHTADVINSSISQGAVFTFEDQSWSASRQDLGSLVVTSVEQDGASWKLVARFDESKATNAILASLHSKIDQDNLSVSLSKSDDGSVTVSTNASGTVPKASDSVAELNASFFVEASRTEAPTYEVGSSELPSSMSFDEAKSFGLVTEISSFTTQYSSGNDARVNNIHVASDYLNDSVCVAGGEWSFNDIAGEATKERGYKDAGAIVGGEYSDAIGGGICQVATTVFNCVYDAGYPVTKRYNHTLRISSYPEGRDAAIAYPDMDLAWQNDTSSDVLLVMTYTNSSVTATLWGADPHYQVSTEYGEWQEGRKFSTTYRTDNTVAEGTEYVETTGVDGSSITIVRTVKDSEGKTLHEDTFSSSYDPKNEVIVKGTAKQ